MFNTNLFEIFYDEIKLKTTSLIKKNYENMAGNSGRF